MPRTKLYVPAGSDGSLAEDEWVGQWVPLGESKQYVDAWDLPASVPEPNLRMSADTLGQAGLNDGDSFSIGSWKPVNDSWSTTSGGFTTEPIYYRAAPTGFNGHPAVEAGVNSGNTAIGRNGLPVTTAGELWVVSRALANSTSGDTPNHYLRPSGSDTPYLAHFWSNSSNQINASVNQSYVGGTAATKLDVTYALRTHWDGANTYWTLNNNSPWISSASNGPTGYEYIWHSRVYNGSRCATSDVLMWGSVLTSAQRTDLWNAINGRYAL